MTSKGFSLVELLVVLAISSSLIALVGPLGYRAIERTRYQTELVAVQRWYDRMGYLAFIRGETIRIGRDGGQRLIAVDERFEVLGEKRVINLAPEYEKVIFTSSGIPSRQQVLFKSASGRSHSISLSGSLSLRSGY